jgi:hypothetical protein
MHSNKRSTARSALGLVLCTLLAAATLGCGVIPFADAPAADYVYGSQQPLRVALIDETGGTDWSPAIGVAMRTYADGVPHLRFQQQTAGANIVVTVRRYSDSRPPALPGYTFQPGVGGFAAVYDADGNACNFPPSRLPLNCNGEVARADIYLNDIIPSGADIEARRLRLILHELGH